VRDSATWVVWAICDLSNLRVVSFVGSYCNLDRNCNRCCMLARSCVLSDRRRGCGWLQRLTLSLMFKLHSIYLRYLSPQSALLY